MLRYEGPRLVLHALTTLSDIMRLYELTGDWKAWIYGLVVAVTDKHFII